MSSTRRRAGVPVDLDGFLDGIQLPSAVVATRSGVGAPWRDLDRRDARDPHWRVLTEDPSLVRRGSACVVRFDAIVTSGLALSDPAMSSDRLVKLELCLDALGDGRAGRLGASTLSTRAGLLDDVLRWRFMRGRPSFRSLVPDDLSDFAAWLAAGRPFPGWIGSGRLALGYDGGAGAGAPMHPSDATRPDLAKSVSGGPDPADDRPGASSLRARLDVWGWLWRASDAGVLSCDRLAFDPGRTHRCGALADRLGRPRGRTATLSPPQFLRILRSALGWALAEGPEVIEALSRSGVGDVPDPALATRVRRLMAACATVIGSLAARRGGEVGSLCAGCMRVGPRGQAISIYIEKTDRAVRQVPVPAVVATVVAILEALTAPTRAATGEDWLFRVLLPGSGRPIELDPSGDLADLAVACGLHEGEHALSEPLASHQLRRGFAMTFYHCYRLGSIDALRRMLRHADEKTTYVYVTEATDGAAISGTDASRAAFARLARDCDPGVRRWLDGELGRLERRLDAGARLNAARFENAELALLRAWREASDGGRSAAGEDVPAPTPVTVRIGSQAGPDCGGPDGLLGMIRAHLKEISR